MEVMNYGGDNRHSTGDRCLWNSHCQRQLWSSNRGPHCQYKCCTTTLVNNHIWWTPGRRKVVADMFVLDLNEVEQVHSCRSVTGVVPSRYFPMHSEGLPPLLEIK